MRARGGSTPNRRGGSPLSTQRQHLLIRGQQLVEGIGRDFDLNPFAAAVMIESVGALRGLAFVDRSHRGRGLALCLVASVRAEENERFTRCRRLLEHNRTFVGFCILNHVETRSRGGRGNANRNDRS